MKNYGRAIVNPTQREPIFGREAEMVQNNAGGYVFKIDPFEQARRFLILGSEGSTYYTSERELTKENATNMLNALVSDPVKAVNMIVEISLSGRASKVDPAIFALALGASCSNATARKLCLEALPVVCRTGTHILQFVSMVNELRGWGRSLRKHVGDWYLKNNVVNLAYQVMKYNNREGFTHRDVLRLTHAFGGEVSTPRGALFRAIAHPEELASLNLDFDELQSFKAAKSLNDSMSVREIRNAICTYNLPREVIPTKFLNDPVVWSALLERMPLMATIRNLGKMSSIGLLTSLSSETASVVSRLNDADYVRKSRIHPITLLNALYTYSSGHGFKGSLSWSPTSVIIDALENAFYKSFDGIEPSNKRTFLALDVSGSMGCGTIAGLNSLTPRDASAVMAMVTARREPQHAMYGFTKQFVDLGISSNMSLREVLRAISSLPFGGTDVSVPMTWATANSVPVDTFVVYTDNETWAGRMHPSRALKEYRQKMGIDAKLVVVGMTSTGFSVADPADAGMLDVVGFDSAAPNIITEFAKGAI